MLLPFYPFDYKAKNKVEKVVLKVLTDSLKKSNEVIKFVMSSLPYVEKAIQLSRRIIQVESPLDPELKLELGLYLREAGHRWETVFMLALA